MPHDKLTLPPGFPFHGKIMSDCPHPLTQVKVGSHVVFVGAAADLTTKDIAAARITLYVPLSHELVRVPPEVMIRPAPLPDFGGVPDNWRQIVDELVGEVERGTRLMFHCIAGHGRTGTMLASLIAVMEPDTADPIAVVRKRYCSHAVETTAQARAIFALRNEQLPPSYRGKFPGDAFAM
ncbi:MAG TPA: hypothetical protein V6D22_02175 [Candidatus Obscuribacterales bacterium]